jgi:NAD(P)-dependent dehydrogenase (short-subunit alcohol dehydrogenase family)
MQLKGKTVVVTGAGGGIGKALVKKFCAEGARSLIAVDINAESVARTAAEFDCIAMTADVTREADVIRVIADTEQDVGPIDLYCNNAGVATGASEQSPNSQWQLSWEVNVLSHVYSARHLVPRMIGRGGGYFLNTASAAGLLNQIGGAAYGTTKHAAVGFAEWLALTYRHQGIKVSMLCPQAVRTAMTANPQDQSTMAASGNGMMEPDQLADIVVEHLARESFLILTHEEVKVYMQRKTSDYDRWIGGMNRLLQKLTGAAP